MPGVVVKFEAAPIRPPSQVEEADNIFCPCDFRCDFEEKVFASAEGGIKADISDFLVKKITPSDTVSIQLVKDSTVVATISNNTYGTYYSSFAAQPLYVGWLADWTAIFNQFSGGRYRVKITTTILGQTSISYSRYFRLNSYDPFEANGTVKIETRQKGRFANGTFDFTNLVEGGWPTYIRLSGRFGDMQPEINRDQYQDSSYREIQNRDEIIREYKLSCELVPETIQNKIASQDVLANEIYITSYGLLQEKKYERFPVVAESFSEVRYDGLGNSYFDITFSDRQKNNIKTNASI